MDEGFDIPVIYKGEELLFPAQLVFFGWTQKIAVDVYGTAISFERDEEREWRALLSAEDLEAGKKVDAALVKAILASLEEILG
jgi:hypothetical protein